MKGEYTAVIDRIVDGETAVILLEADGEVIEQFDVSVSRLPAETESGSVLSVTVEDDEIVAMRSMPDKTADRKQRMRKKLDRLSKRLDEE